MALLIWHRFLDCFGRKTPEKSGQALAMSFVLSVLANEVKQSLYLPNNPVEIYKEEIKKSKEYFVNS